MYKPKTHIHFTGIGGIGMSGLAIILHEQGFQISGCDVDHNQKSIHFLKSLGCAIHQGNNTPECSQVPYDILVYSTAIAGSELEQARSQGIPVIHRSVMLAELMRTKWSIAITGSHGKTTTTSLIAHIFLHAQQDPTVIVGGHLQSLGTNAYWGKGPVLIAEADESDRSFLNLSPTIAVVTNIDLEHVETYRDIHDLKESFKTFLNRLPFYGKAVVCLDDEHAASLLTEIPCTVHTYGTTHKADVFATNITLLAQQTEFTLWHHGQQLGLITSTLAGHHNMLNALAAISVALEFGIAFKDIAQALACFPGVERRFTLRGTYKGAHIFDDYGHHPREIHNTLIVARRRAEGKLIVIFQPHRYTRTHRLWNDFIETFIMHAPDQLIITDIYGAFEQPIEGVCSQNLVKDLQTRNPALNVSYVPYNQNFSHLIERLDGHIAHNDLVLLLGAGKLTLLPNHLSILSHTA
jgi:UDP-N-acetylmuramate--alanine ligase